MLAVIVVRLCSTAQRVSAAMACACFTSSSAISLAQKPRRPHDQCHGSWRMSNEPASKLVCSAVQCNALVKKQGSPLT